MQKEKMALLCSGAFLPAMPLVLNERRQFDPQGQRRLVRYYLSAGADGIAAAVHTTQFEIRQSPHNLLEPVLRTVSQEMDAWASRHPRPLLKIAGACGPTQQALAEARLAKALGYDAVLLSPGGLAGLTPEDLLARTRAVAEVLPVIGFYLQPAVGGRVFRYDYWEQLVQIPNVVAVKCAAFDRYLTGDVARAIALTGSSAALYTGNDDHIIGDLLTVYQFEHNGQTRTVRTVGGLLGHWAVWTHTAVDLFHRARAAARSGVIDAQWMTLAAQITDANSAFFDTQNGFRGCIAGIHEVLRRQGLMPGIWCLDPQETLSPGQAEQIDRVYTMYPHLCDDDFVREFLASPEG
jgi:hypothetical protein